MKRYNEIVKLHLSEIIPYENNPRRNDDAVDKVANSIREFGYVTKIAVDENNVIISGHTRRKALLTLHPDDDPVIEVIKVHDTPERIKALRIADNKVGEFATWDEELLDKEIAELTEIDMSEFGFTEDVMMDEPFEEDLPKSTVGKDYQTLVEKYIIPPFSVLDTKQGYWQDRKKIWNKYLKSGQGRKEGLTYNMGLNVKKNLEKGFKGEKEQTTSIFDPVLCEIMYRWFCPKGGRVIDPFAGGSVRGMVASMLGNQYTGIDLSSEQIEANEKCFEQFPFTINLENEPLDKPKWINGDSMNIKTLTDGHTFDFFLTCPPYSYLEKYSDDPDDLSNMDYPEFKKRYAKIIKDSCDILEDDSFAVIVVGEVRGKDGNYLGFVRDTVNVFEDSGMKYYNEFSLITQIGTAPLRVDPTFKPYRKCTKTHQNVLVFLKGDVKNVMRKLNDNPYCMELDFEDYIESD